MKQEDKELLLRDLCARLPYGVKVLYQVGSQIPDIKFFDGKQYEELKHGSILDDWLKCTFKPYLFPLSSMTEEQFMELKVFADLTYEGNTLELVEWDDNYKTLEFWLEEIPSYHLIKVFDWLNKNHFDYRGLIEKSLALDATNLGIYEL